jgi:hypothetical protein
MVSLGFGSIHGSRDPQPRGSWTWVWAAKGDVEGWGRSSRDPSKVRVEARGDSNSEDVAASWDR